MNLARYLVKMTGRNHHPVILSKVITFTPQCMPNDSQNMQHARQPGDSDAEVVVQYLTSDSSKGKSVLHLLRAWLSSKTSITTIIQSCCILIGE